MKKIIFLISVLMTSCTQQTEQAEVKPVAQETTTTSYSQADLIGMHARAKKLLADIESKKSLAMMYDSPEDSVELNNLSLSMNKTKASLLPDSDLAAPYYPCDTAYSDLSILIAAMSRYIADRTDSNSQIVESETLDYEQSLTRCKVRVAMQPNQARADAGL